MYKIEKAVKLRSLPAPDFLLLDSSDLFGVTLEIFRVAPLESTSFILMCVRSESGPVRVRISKGQFQTSRECGAHPRQWHLYLQGNKRMQHWCLVGKMRTLW